MTTAFVDYTNTFKHNHEKCPKAIVRGLAINKTYCHTTGGIRSTV